MPICCRRGVKEVPFLENKCPHCGQPLPKSSAFCLHCMQGLHDKDVPTASDNKRKKGAVILCLLLLLFALSGSVAFALTRHARSASVTEAPQTASTTIAPVTAATTTQPTGADVQTTTEKQTKKETTNATTAPTATTQENTTQAAPQTTKAPETTASNQVIISGSVLSDYPNTRRDSSYTIPYGVTSIANNAFHGNPYLRSLKFSKRTNVSCNWSNLFASLPNLERIYIYTGTTADTQGMQYFDGEIIYYYD